MLRTLCLLLSAGIYSPLRRVMHTQAFYILTLGNSGFGNIIHTDTHLIHIRPQSDIKTRWETFTAEERDLKRSGFVGNSNGKVKVATTSVRAEAGSASKLPLGLFVAILLMYHT